MPDRPTRQTLTLTFDHALSIEEWRAVIRRIQRAALPYQPWCHIDPKPLDSLPRDPRPAPAGRQETKSPEQVAG